MKSTHFQYLAFCIAAMCGCSSTSSDNVDTPGISANIDVYANGSGGTAVTAELEVGSGFGGTSLELSSGDSLTVTANGIQQSMIVDESIFGRFSYVTSFGFDDADTLFTVSLSRAGGISAPNSNVLLPEDIAILSPANTDVFGPNDAINIVWQPAGSAFAPLIEVTLTCYRASGLPIPGIKLFTPSSDTGFANVPVDDVMTDITIDPKQLCDGDIELSRWRQGTLDPNYGEGGQISAERRERTQFSVNPGL